LLFYYLCGITVGLTLSIPFGPVGFFCMERTLINGRKNGFISSLGMTTVDLLYNTIVLLFIDNITPTILKYERYFKIVAGILLVLIGIRKITNEIELKHSSSPPTGYLKSYLSIFFIALSNVSSFLIIGGIYTYFRIFENFEDRGIPFALAGVLTADLSVWITTTYILDKKRQSVSEAGLIKIIKSFGWLILICGIIMVIHSIGSFV